VLSAGYHRSVVTDRAGAVYRVEVTDDEGATMMEWFGSPPISLEKDMVFASLEPRTGTLGLFLEASSDELLLGTPSVTSGRGRELAVFRTGPLDYVAFTGPASSAPGTAVFTLSGIDYRGYQADEATAAIVLALESGERARFVLADTLEAFLEASSLRDDTTVLVSETAVGRPAGRGLEKEAGPFRLDFPRRNLSRPLRLVCSPGDKTGLFKWEDEKGWKCRGVPAMEGGAVSIDKPGTYCYFSDRLPPELTHVAVEDNHAGSGFFKPFYCAVPVKETGSGVDPWSAAAYLGGERVVCEWDEFRGALIIPVPASFPVGRTVLTVEVSDRTGNRSVGEFGFMIE
jgi:hypothetical protein